MEPQPKNEASPPLRVFRTRRLPEPGHPAGYSALIQAHDLEAVLPHRLCAIGLRHRRVEADGWRLLSPRHAPEDSLLGQLTFALKWEGVDLLVLKQLFSALDPRLLVALVLSRPTGSYTRRIWFLYEWLLGRRLDLPDASTGNFVPALDPKLQFTVPGALSRRQRVRNNLPGTPQFCPLVFKTPTLSALVEQDLSARARDVLAPLPADVVARAAAFLLLQDSKSTFAIEGERPPRNRLEGWSQAVGQAGKNPLDLAEILRLQHLIIGDSRFVNMGLRTEGGFVGEHERDSGAPIPSHISARPEVVAELVSGLVEFCSRSSRSIDAVVAAACVAFGFVYIHPLQDGNGRLHRYLIHHVLAERGFTPPGLVFPVSAVILRRIQQYRETLECYSRPLLPCIRWEATERGNVIVTHDTADYYRFFDATPHAEFLYRCVQATIEEDLPRETAFLQAYDRFVAAVQRLVDMPNTTVDLLSRFLRQNDGKLSARARSREFQGLTGEEISRVEELFEIEAGAFRGPASQSPEP